MSLSKASRVCEICRKEPSVYSCPRCDRKYCSSDCYRAPDHRRCSESFYQEWVEISLQNEDRDSKDQREMVEILKRCYDEWSQDSEDYEPPIHERFDCLSVDEEDENTLWEKLSAEEKAKFKALIKDGSKLEEIVSFKQPWWNVKTINLVSDLSSDEDLADGVSSRPVFPLNVKKLTELTSKPPSDYLKFNIINILYSYAFLYRFYNCDLRDFLDDVTMSLFSISPVLCGSKIYHTLEESIQDTIRLILSLDLNVSVDFVKSIISDVNCIVQGPSNAKPSTFVLCALNDIKALFLEAKQRSQEIPKDVKKQIMPAVKKIEYFMSWSSDYESTLTAVASDLLIIMMPDLIMQPRVSKENYQKVTVNKPPIIEEIS